MLPGLRLPDIPAFDLSWAFRNGWVLLGIAVALLVLGALLGRRLRAFWRQFGQGLAIVRRPRRYLAHVVPWQALGWACRIGGAWFFLDAFGIPAGIENAFIVQVAGSLGSLFPATPGGLGPTQALLVVMLAGEAGRTGILAFSAGMELTLLIVNVALAVVCMALMLRNLRFRRAIAQARADQAADVPRQG